MAYSLGRWDDTGDAITMAHVMLGMKREYQKLGRIVTAQDFAHWFDTVGTTDDASPGR
jgi:hypothetical protein